MTARFSTYCIHSSKLSLRVCCYRGFYKHTVCAHFLLLNLLFSLLEVRELKLYKEGKKIVYLLLSFNQMWLRQMTTERASRLHALLFTLSDSAVICVEDKNTSDSWS